MGVVENCNRLKNIPKRTRMKIQAHPGLPPMPFMFSMAAASNPEKAPDSWVNLRKKNILLSTLQRTVADDKNKAILDNQLRDGRCQNCNPATYLKDNSFRV
jgi:hypothetical protein